MGTSRTHYNDPDHEGSLGLPYHWEMVSDAQRLRAFQRAIDQTCNRKVVLETGAGSGVLSLMALRAGASQVIAVERDHRVAAFARKNFAASGFESARLVEKDILSVDRRDLGVEAVDVVIAEHLSTWQVTEPQIAVMNHINCSIATPETIRLPSRLWNFVELTSVDFTIDDVLSLPTRFIEFTGIPPATALSGKRLFREVPLSMPQSATNAGEITLEAFLPGVVNSVRLTSPVEVCPGILFQGSDTLMPAIVVPTDDRCAVEPGDLVRLKIGYEMGDGWDSFHCNVQNM